MIGTNALVVNLSDSALKKLVSVWIKTWSERRFSFQFKKPLKVRLTLDEFHPESLAITPKGIEGCVNTRFHLGQKILGAELTLSGTVQILFNHILSFRHGIIHSKTTMIDFTWIKHPKLLVENSFQANLMDNLDPLISKFNSAIFTQLDKLIEQEIASDKWSDLLDSQLEKVSLFQSWRNRKLALKVSHLDYKLSQLDLEIKVRLPSDFPIHDMDEIAVNGMNRDTGKQDYQFFFSYAILDDFLTQMLRKEHQRIWSIFAVSEITTHLFESRVLTEMRSRFKLPGSVGFEWEFNPSASGKPILLIKRIRVGNWKLPKFIGEWIFRRVSKMAIKWSSQLIQKVKGEIISQLPQHDLTFIVDGFPDVTDVVIDQNGIVVSTKDPQKIIIV